MWQHFQWIRGILVVSIISSIAVIGCGSAVFNTSNSDAGAVAAMQNDVVIPQGEDVFAPFILPTQPHSTITWHNNDPVSHSITTTPEHASYLNPQSMAVTIGAGQSAKLTFEQPGIYHYYDASFSTWNADFQRLVPLTGVPKFPLTMEGIIWVQGAISGLPKTAKNSVIFLHDRVESNFVAIATGGTVTWHNYDTDAHFFQPILGYDAPINPVDIGINNLRGANDVPPIGESKSLTFTTPGLYYYYCFTHAKIDPVLLRSVAMPMASEYPVPMEGFVLVTDS